VSSVKCQVTSVVEIQYDAIGAILDH
jgi:hypothetical protein